MKMELVEEELLELVEGSEKDLRGAIEDLFSRYGQDVSLQQLRASRNDVFFKTYDAIIEVVEEGGYSYDFERLGRLSNMLYQGLESVWLEYVR